MQAIYTLQNYCDWLRSLMWNIKLTICFISRGEHWGKDTDLCKCGVTVPVSDYGQRTCEKMLLVTCSITHLD